jgi:hypothetical protein
MDTTAAQLRAGYLAGRTAAGLRNSNRAVCGQQSPGPTKPQKAL